MRGRSQRAPCQSRDRGDRMNYCGETEEAASLASWERAGGEGGAERRVGSEKEETTAIEARRGRDVGRCGGASAAGP